MNVLRVSRELFNYLPAPQTALSEETLNKVESVISFTMPLSPFVPIGPVMLLGVSCFQNHMDKKDALAWASLLIADDMDHLTKESLLDTMQEIPFAQRADVMQHALPLMHDEMSGLEKRNLLKVMQNIPSAERAEIIELASLAMQENMNGYDKSNILQAVQNIPIQERFNIIRLSLTFVHDHMNVQEKTHLFWAILAIPAQERNQRTEKTFEQLNMDFPDGALNVRVYFNRTLDLLKTPLHQDFLPMAIPQGAMAIAAAAGQAAINVHEGLREARIAEALQLLRKSQAMTAAEIELALKDCVEYLKDYGCAKALRVLLGPQDPRDFGPFFKPFIIHGVHTSGQEVIGRLWLFIQMLTPEKEREIALDAMIIELNRCINENDERICDPGKMERVFIGVLQGRLKGVRIDDSIEIPEATQEKNAPKSISIQAAIEMFFHVKTNRTIKDLQTLLQAAAIFCNENPSVDPKLFITEIRAYARASKIK